MSPEMETDKVNEFKTVCKQYFDGQGLTVYFDTAVSANIAWRPHIFATNHQKLILDILTQDKIPNFYTKKYADIRNTSPEIEIYVGLVGDLDYFPDVMIECARKGLGIYKINRTLKLLIEARPPTIEGLAEQDQFAIVFGRPYSNILALKKCFRQCRSELYWFERNLPKKVFETLFEAIEEGDIQNINTIKLLRGIDDKVDESFRDEFLSFKQEVLAHGIASEFRIMCDSSIASRVHGRYAYSKKENNDPLFISLPPLNSLKANQWDTILTDPSEIPPFQEFWETGLDVESSWTQIKARVVQYCQARAQELEAQARALRSRLPP
jgi:hypothetical protein